MESGGLRGAPPAVSTAAQMLRPAGGLAPLVAKMLPYRVVGTLVALALAPGPSVTWRTSRCDEEAVTRPHRRLGTSRSRRRWSSSAPSSGDPSQSCHCDVAATYGIRCRSPWWGQRPGSSAPGLPGRSGPRRRDPRPRRLRVWSAPCRAASGQRKYSALGGQATVPVRSRVHAPVAMPVRKKGRKKANGMATSIGPVSVSWTSRRSSSRTR